MQHAEGGIAERVDPFGVKVLLQQAAKHVANSLVREVFPDDHESPRIGIGAQTRRSTGSGGTTLRDFATIRRLHQPHDSFRNSSHGTPILLCRAKNEGMLERPTRSLGRAMSSSTTLRFSVAWAMEMPGLRWPSAT